MVALEARTIHATGKVHNALKAKEACTKLKEKFDQTVAGLEQELANVNRGAGKVQGSLIVLVRWIFAHD